MSVGEGEREWEGGREGGRECKRVRVREGASDREEVRGRVCKKEG